MNEPAPRILAALAPDLDQPGRRTESLTPETWDLLAWVFANATVPPGLPLCAVELRLDDLLHNLLYGNGGCHLHGGNDALRYFRHADDPDWALIFAQDCAGDAERGAERIRTLRYSQTVLC